MTSDDSQNPLNMGPDPYAGDTFVLPKTKCTLERRLFFRRLNEITGFLYVTKFSLDECKKRYAETIIPKLPFEEKTPIKIQLNSGNYVVMPAARLLNFTVDGVNVLTRQTLVMFYGSFETYLYQLFDRSFQAVGITENQFDISRDILMSRKWDGKFCKMSEVFNIGYRANDIVNHYSSFPLEFEGTKHKNPLHFLDDLAQVRHRIVHASSILEKDKMIFIDINSSHELFGFFFLLTDYIDILFVKRFGYTRDEVNPAEA